MPKPQAPSPSGAVPRHRPRGLRADDRGRIATQATYLRSPAEADQLSSVIGHAYDAALDPSLWPAAIEGACGFLDCYAGAIGAVDFLQGSPNLVIQWGYEREVWQRYIDHYFHRNTLNLPAFRTEIGQVMTISSFDLQLHAEFLASDFYKEWAEPQGFIDAIQATLDRTASGIALLTLARHKRAGVTGEREIRRMGLIAPHFRRAILIGRVIDLQKVEAKAFAETIDGLATGVFLVGGEGGLVHANQSGHAMLEAEDPLKVVQGTLVATDERAHRLLRDVFAAAKDGDSAIATTGIAVALTGRDGDHFIAHVLPLTAGARRHAGVTHSAAAALFVRKAAVDLPAAIGAATQLYGMTPAEVRVLRGVIEVGGIAPVGAMLGVAKGTVKWHLQHLFEKTATRRQADLVKLIAGFESPARLPKKK